MGLFFSKTLELSIVQLGIGVFAFWILFANKGIPICYRYSNEPLPHQRLARTLFFIAAIVLSIGGLWGLWNEWHLNQH